MIRMTLAEQDNSGAVQFRRPGQLNDIEGNLDTGDSGLASNIGGDMHADGHDDLITGTYSSCERAAAIASR